MVERGIRYGYFNSNKGRVDLELYSNGDGELIWHITGRLADIMPSFSSVDSAVNHLVHGLGGKLKSK